MWALATTNPDLEAKLLAWALEFLTHVDRVDDGMLRGFQELFAEFNAQLLDKSVGSRRSCNQPPSRLACRAALDRPGKRRADSMGVRIARQACGVRAVIAVGRPPPSFTF